MEDRPEMEWKKLEGPLAALRERFDMDNIASLGTQYIPDGVEFGIELKWSEGFWELNCWDECSFAFHATWKAKTLEELDDVVRRFGEGNFVAGEFETDDDDARYGKDLDGEED